MRSWACWLNSAPWSQVNDRRSCSGRVVIVRVMASRTAPAPWPASAGPFLTRAPGPWPSMGGRCSSIVSRVVRSTTRFTMLLHLPPMDGHGPGARVKNGPALAGHGAGAVRDAITRTITTLPEQLRRSLTWDQGAELSQHAQLRIETGVQIYFCDPHSPW